MTETEKIVIEVDQLGRGHIKVGDRDMSNIVRAVTVSARVGEVTVVTMEVVQSAVEIHADVRKLRYVSGRSMWQKLLEWPSSVRRWRGQVLARRNLLRRLRVHR